MEHHFTPCLLLHQANPNMVSPSNASPQEHQIAKEPTGSRQTSKSARAQPQNTQAAKDSGQAAREAKTKASKNTKSAPTL